MIENVVKWKRYATIPNVMTVTEKCNKKMQIFHIWRFVPASNCRFNSNGTIFIVPKMMQNHLLKNHRWRHQLLRTSTFFATFLVGLWFERCNANKWYESLANSNLQSNVVRVKTCITRIRYKIVVGGVRISCLNYFIVLLNNSFLFHPRSQNLSVVFVKIESII